MPEPSPAKRQSARTKARKRALDILFEADLREQPADEVLAAHLAVNDPPVRDFTVELVRGVVADQARIDQVLTGCLASGWTLERMPRVDRNLARIAVYELGCAGVPADVAVAEAIALSQELSTDESPGFLNGVLSAVILAGAAEKTG